MTDKKHTILVVEDEALLLEAISKKLKLSNFNVAPAHSGKEGLDYLEKAPLVPDAIWLDYYLGDIDGLVFMKTIIGNQKWAKIPVVVISNSASPDKVHSMLGLGAKKYLIKAEHRLDEIIDEIKKFIVTEKEIKQ